MRRAIDLSNYDWPFTAEMVTAFLAAGFECVIIGSQDPDRADAQASLCRDGGMEVIATYAEPFSDGAAPGTTQAAIDLAKRTGARRVYAACETGGVDSLPELRTIIAQIESAGLEAGIYAGKPTWQSLFANTTEFARLPLWFPSYFDDGRIVDSVAFGGWTKVTIHQYASTPELAGRNRDRNAILIEEETDDVNAADINEALQKRMALTRIAYTLLSRANDPSIEVVENNLDALDKAGFRP